MRGEGEREAEFFMLREDKEFESLTGCTWVGTYMSTIANTWTPSLSTSHVSYFSQYSGRSLIARFFLHTTLLPS